MDESIIAQIGPHSPSAAACSVFLAGLGFLIFELFLTYGPAQSLLRRAFAANPKLDSKQVEQRIREANSRLVGTLHLLIQIPCATYVIWTPSIAQDRLHAKTPQSQLLLAISAGYFLYDAFISVLRYEGIAYLMHGFLACILYTYGAVTGFLGYYGAMFILWECSTPFVYMRWFLYNFGWADTKVYIANGLTMLASFFIFRNVVGTAMSVEFWRVSGRQMLNPIPGGVTGVALWFYRLTCLVLNSLNAMWFAKMVQGAVKALRSISAPPAPPAVDVIAMDRPASAVQRTKVE